MKHALNLTLPIKQDLKRLQNYRNLRQYSLSTSKKRLPKHWPCPN